MKIIKTRTVHRYLGVLVGIQLLLWTTSGLIFSWNPIEKVRGEHMLRPAPTADLGQFELLPIAEVISLAQADLDGRAITRVELRMMLSEPVIELTVRDDQLEQDSYLLYHARNGQRISPITPAVAMQIAVQDFSETVQATSAEWVAEAGRHSEYRGKELPAYRVQLDHPTDTRIYVSAHRGLVTTRRNNRWRLFDFFWMLHTMDYQGRDNFNHWLLKSASVMGLVTVLSGFWLWWRTSRIRRRWRKKRQP